MKKFMAVMAMVAIVAFAAPALAATNPFMDVPQGHWAYDAVGLLASRGIVSGYPDGSFKGPQPATRYEVASIVARALVAIDADKASKQDLELLKKLVMEFKDELDALGVKVDKLDKRVAVLEDGIGGWKIRGNFRFDAKFSSDTDNGNYNYNENGLKNDFEKERFRLFLTKTIDENTYFYAQYRTGASASGAPAGRDGRGDLQNMRWSHLFVNTKLPYDINFRVGRFAVDFEGDYGLYDDWDAIFGDYRIDGFQLSKNWGNFKATAVIGRNGAFDVADGTIANVRGNAMNYALDLSYKAERWFLGGTGYWWKYDGIVDGLDADINTYAVYAGFNFTPAIGLKGIYYWQDADGFYGDTDGKAWKAILDVKQDALKFTSLWVEYSQQDNDFLGALNDRYSLGDNADFAGRNIAVADPAGRTKWWFVKAAQKWNAKWSSFIRYAHADFDTAGLDDATEWGVGIGYQYTPAIYFELAYDQVDHGDSEWGNLGGERGKDHVVRFRTNVNF
jgi:hypothetical protein